MNKDQTLYSDIASAVNYDMETGIFTWKFRDGKSKCDKRFNGKLGGKECGRILTTGYRALSIKINGKSVQIRLHRLAWFIVYGVIPEHDIDHIDRDKLNNRISNLRDVQRTINLRNSKMKSNNTSGVTGVFWRKDNKKWIAAANNGGRTCYVGAFLDKDEAEAAVKAFRERHGYTKSHGEPR